MTNERIRCWAEISEAALAFNIRQLNQIGPAVMAVVKADAYGHDVNLVVPLLQKYGISRFAVATVAEAAELRVLPDMDSTQIYLMAAVLPEEADDVVARGLTAMASDTAFVKALSDAAVRQQRSVSVHMEIDTGIGRAGIAPENLSSTLQVWSSLPGIKVTGVCTHFTSADAFDPADPIGQSGLFQGLLCEIPGQMLSELAVHSANSPAALRLNLTDSTLFRPGLLLYGIPPSPALSTDFPYHPVLSLKARALLVRRMPAGSDISYSRTYRLPKEATIATIGIGYGDGYPRRLSGIGSVLLPCGAEAPIRGRVCMDQICVEIPDGASLKQGDAVTLIGAVGNQSISVSQIAQMIDTTPHEITTCLTSRVVRTLEA